MCIKSIKCDQHYQILKLFLNFFLGVGGWVGGGNISELIRIIAKMFMLMLSKRLSLSEVMTGNG